MTQTTHRASLARLGRLGAVALCAATVAACGGTGTSTGTTDRASAARDGALKFAQCMRKNGIDMPDPKVDGNGRVAVTINGGPKSGSAQGDLDQAQQECGKYMEDVGGGDAPDAATQARMQDAMLAHARCMREHGIDMPDPQFSTSGGRTTSKLVRKGGKSGDAGAVDGPDSSRFKAADKACRPLLEDAGPGAADSQSTATDAP